MKYLKYYENIDPFEEYWMEYELPTHKIGVNLNISDIEGFEFKEIIVNDAETEIKFITDNEEIYLMYHEQGCCEEVYLADVIGDMDDLINTEIIKAVESSNDLGSLSPNDESWTWTFYIIDTMKGSVTFRWYGSSNGYYSESVSFMRIK